MDWLRKVVQNPRTERFIMALIVLNAVTLGLETSQTVMARFGPLLTVIDRIIIAVFVIEILARFAVQRAAFFCARDRGVLGLARTPGVAPA